MQEGDLDMEFTFHTVYDQKAMTALARGLRKTLRAKRNRRSRILGTIVSVVGFLLIWYRGTIDFRSVLTAAAILVILYVLLCEDNLNGSIAKKRGLPGLNESVTTFAEGSYHSVTPLGKTTFYYNNILAAAETPDYFLLLFSQSHGQVYSKASLTGGSEDDFRSFIEDKTNLTVQRI